MRIQVIGPGCSRCNQLYETVSKVVAEMEIPCTVEKVSDLQQLLALNVISTPVLVVDGQVRTAGRVPSISEIRQLLA